ncbi:hypothetical protein KSS87_012212, partial [Heliosperma pusillum]
MTNYSPFITNSSSSSLLLFNPITSNHAKIQSSFWPVNKRNNHQLGWALRLRCDALSKHTST